MEKDYKTDFNVLLEDLRQNLLSAQVSLDIWKALFTSPEVVNILNRYKGFFTPTRFAHRDLLFIKLFNVMDSDTRAPSLNRILKMVELHPDLGQGIDILALRNRLKKHRDVLVRIGKFRKTRAAHWDTNVSEPFKEIHLGEIISLLKELEDIFNEIHRAH
ncbi:MAG: hypothetical protein Q7R34_14020, partial [Dehalococcoidia bacterium]|nr:hypothetical protein [Dehalococcoidia bacterium]